jgi:hypothetical protein
MRNISRFPAFAVATTAAFSVATLAPPVANTAIAQGLQPRGITQSYYYGYSPIYTSYDDGYGYSTSGRSGYTYYGSGPYGYGSSALYGYPSYRGYGYGNRTPYNLYYNGLRSHSRTYSRIYNPYNAGVYSPYGSGGY